MIMHKMNELIEISYFGSNFCSTVRNPMCIQYTPNVCFVRKYKIFFTVSGHFSNGKENAKPDKAIETKSALVFE